MPLRATDFLWWFSPERKSQLQILWKKKRYFSRLILRAVFPWKENPHWLGSSRRAGWVQRTHGNQFHPFVHWGVFCVWPQNIYEMIRVALMTTMVIMMMLTMMMVMKILTMMMMEMEILTGMIMVKPRWLQTVRLGWQCACRQLEAASWSNFFFYNLYFSFLAPQML